MKQVYYIDVDGYYVKPVIIGENEEMTSNLISIPPIQGLYRAKWTGTEWIEDMPQEEIDALNNQPKEPTETEKLQQRITELETVIDTMLTGGTI